MRRYVLASVVFVAAAVTLGAPSSVQADGTQSSQFPQYSVQVLNFPAKYTQGGNATALNDNGDVVGYGAYYTGDPVYTAYDALLWRNGVASDINSQVHGGTPIAIGDNDDVLGSCSDSQSCDTFVADLNAGTYETTGLATARGLNPQGTIAVGNVSGGFLAGEWQNGVAAALPDANTTSSAIAINTEGVIAGERTAPPSVSSTPEVWTSSGTQAIPGVCGFGAALAINDEGDTVGEGQGDCSWQYSFLNHDGQTIDLGVLPYFETSQPVGIDGGMIVGNDLSDAASAPYLYEGHQMMPLQSLLAPGTSWQLTWADAVNRVGQILAYGENNNGVSSSLLLTPKAHLRRRHFQRCPRFLSPQPPFRSLREVRSSCRRRPIGPTVRRAC